MRYLIFTNTPAHVHLYKHVVERLESGGHEVLVLARDYGCTRSLLDYYELPYYVYGGCDTTRASLLQNLPEQYARSFYRGRRFDPDVVFGMGAYAAHTGAVTGARTVLVLDSEPTRIDHRISKPFATAILTPDRLRRTLGPKHYEFQGFKECAYLHPAVFESDSGIRDRLGVGDEPYVIVRLNAFGSHHDVSQDGFTQSQVSSLVDLLSEDVTVFVSDEGGEFDLTGTEAQPFDLHPARLHDALAEAQFVIADTQTMVTEAALLGTPAIRSNSFVGPDDMGNFRDLADRGLVYNIASFEDVRSKAVELVQDHDGEQFQARREALLAETVDLTSLLVEVAQNIDEIDSISGLERASEPSVRGRDVVSPP